MQTASFWTLIGWKSDQTTFVPLWDRMEGAVAMPTASGEVLAAGITLCFRGGAQAR
jgi:hypothetical protein